MPPNKSATPIHAIAVKDSPTKNTPKSAAVNGSPKESVTAAEDDIFCNPFKKSMYAILVPKMPIIAIGNQLLGQVIHSIPKYIDRGSRIIPQIVKVIATAGNVASRSINDLLICV